MLSEALNREACVGGMSSYYTAQLQHALQGISNHQQSLHDTTRCDPVQWSAMATCSAATLGCSQQTRDGEAKALQENMDLQCPLGVQKLLQVAENPCLQPHGAACHQADPPAPHAHHQHPCPSSDQTDASDCEDWTCASTPDVLPHNAAL